MEPSEPSENITYLRNNLSYEINYNDDNYTTNNIFTNENPDDYIENVLLVILLYVFCTISGRIVSMVSNTPPPFLGMMLAGLVLKSSGVYVLDERWTNFWWYYSEITQSVILIMSCLKMSSWKLRQFSGAVLSLAFFPKTIETVTIGVVGYFILSPELMKSNSNNIFLINYSSINSVLLMSSLSSLKHFGNFGNSNVYTLLNATSSLIDIGAVIFNYFSIYHSGLLCDKSWIVIIKSVAIQITIDIVFGIIWGKIMINAQPSTWFNLYDKQECRNDNNQGVYRYKTKFVALVFVGGCLIKEIKKYYSLPLSFSLACAISSFVAGTELRRMLCRNHNCNIPNTIFDVVIEDLNQMLEIIKAFEYIWKFLQPLFFGFLGIVFQFQYIDIQLLFVILAILVIVLTIHILFTACSVLGFGFNRYEVAFINIVWLPNSTLGVVVMAILFNILSCQQQFNLFGLTSKIINISLITTLVTTTLGAFAIKRYGPTLLSKTVDSQFDNAG